ncbi:MAG: response regulator [Candidatus Ratteibacteria bacterium]|nr:response regulator [Candidatus Ratteibacteria bacterium]
MKKKNKIIIVDDEKSVRESMEMILKDKYELLIFTRGDEILKEFQEDMADVALVDIKMPGMSGIELLKQFKTMDEDLEIIMITGYGTLNSATEAMRNGASAYVNKPFSKDKLIEIIEEKIKKREKSRKKKKRLVELENVKKSLDERTKGFYSSTVNSLLAAIHAKDGYTSIHSEQVARYALLILDACASFIKLLPEEKDIFRYLVSLHDIGKIGIPETVLGKDRKLNSQEWEIIKKHPEIGVSIVNPILNPMSALKDYICIIQDHHERYDGTGYPNGKKGDEIPLLACIISIADVYHAMRSNRPYRKALSKKETLKNLRAGRGTHFNPKILDIALKILEDYGD